MRSKLGSHSFELVAGLVFLVPIMLYAIDYATVVYGGEMNNNLCAAAARAAASGPATFYASNSNPYTRAAAILAAASNPHAIVHVKQTVRIREICNPPYPIPNFGGPLLGSVTVKTRCDVLPPFQLPMVPADVVLYTSQTYPWSWINPGSVPLTAGGMAITTTNDISLPISSASP